MRKFARSRSSARRRFWRGAAPVAGVPAAVDCLESRLLLTAPDLVPTQLQTAANANPGQAIDVQWAVTNSGDQAAGGFTVEFFLSEDTFPGGPDDVSLGSETVTGLTANGGSTGTLTKSVTLPGAQSTFWNGDKSYRILMAVDTLQSVSETNETNNDRGTTINVTGTGSGVGDLNGTLDVAAAATAGGSPNAMWNVTNSSTTAAGSFQVEFLLSLDSRLDASDVSLGTQQVNGLNAGATVTRTTPLMLPAAGNSYWTGDASYVVLMRIDSLSAVPESNEQNNLLSDPIQVTGTGNSFADLTGVLTVPGGPVDAGTDISFTWNVTNNGVANSAAAEVHFYLSSDPFIGPQDTAFRSRPVAALGIGQSTGVTTEIYRLPPPGSPVYDQPTSGNYYLVIIIDQADTVPESDPGTANNVVAGELQINVSQGALPDLAPESFTPPAAGIAGANINVNWRVINQGQGAAGSFGTMFYLSNEPGITPMSRLLTTANTAGLAGSTSTGLRTTSLALPAVGDSFWLGDGTYYLIMAVDDFGTVQETDETNNSSAFIPISISGTDGSTPVSLDVDVSGSANVFTDGILIARHLVGFTGNALVRNATAANATRTAAAEITAYLNGPGAAMLDVDGNGVRSAFTDGILIARYLVGFRGPALTNGITFSGNSTRTTATQITTFLDMFRPAAASSAAAPAPAPVAAAVIPAPVMAASDFGKSDLFQQTSAVPDARLAGHTSPSKAAVNAAEHADESGRLENLGGSDTDSAMVLEDRNRNSSKSSAIDSAFSDVQDLLAVL